MIVTLNLGELFDQRREVLSDTGKKGCRRDVEIVHKCGSNMKGVSIDSFSEDNFKVPSLEGAGEGEGHG